MYAYATRPVVSMVTGNYGVLGGGIHHTFGTATIANNVIVNNSANGGGGIKNEWGQPLLTNCILWGNRASSGEQIFIQGQVITIEYSDVEGGLEGVEGFKNGEIIWGPGMIDAAASFVSTRGA